MKELDRLPRIELVRHPTPVRRLNKRFAKAEVWLKDDGQSHPIYGGNKPRKLEYLLTSPKKGILTFGYEGSNHALASAYHCAQLGIECRLVLVQLNLKKGPGVEQARNQIEKKMAALKRFDPKIYQAPSVAAAVGMTAAAWLKDSRTLEIVPPGGSNAAGTLGYIRGALELANQVKSGELPEPEALFVALGTGGTAVGIAMGLAAAGLKTVVHAVKVVPGLANEYFMLRRLGRSVLRLVPSLGEESAELRNLVIERNQLGTGYSHPTIPALAVVEDWREQESVSLDLTYTAKTAAALEGWLSRAESKGPVLFWNTYSELRI